MADLLVAIGLIFVLEGLIFAAFPDSAKKAVSAVLDTPSAVLRTIGLGSAVIGVVLVWLVRG